MVFWLNFWIDTWLGYPSHKAVYISFCKKVWQLFLIGFGVYFYIWGTQILFITHYLIFCRTIVFQFDKSYIIKINFVDLPGMAYWQSKIIKKNLCIFSGYQFYLFEDSWEFKTSAATILSIPKTYYLSVVRFSENWDERAFLKIESSLQNTCAYHCLYWIIFFISCL